MGFKEFVGDIKKVLNDFSPEAARARKELEQREALAASEARLRGLIDRVAPPSTEPVSEWDCIALPQVRRYLGNSADGSNSFFDATVIRDSKGGTELTVKEDWKSFNRPSGGRARDIIWHESVEVVSFSVPPHAASGTVVSVKKGLNADSLSGPQPITDVLDVTRYMNSALGVLNMVAAEQQKLADSQAAANAAQAGSVYQQK